MDERLAQAIEELARHNAQVELGSKHAIVGLDGFVDRIMHVVGTRHGLGDESFDPVPTIGAFGEKIAAAAGKSANFEMWRQREKIGGNGPILANALLTAGLKLGYLGMLGRPIHPLFADFARRSNAISLGDPGVTHALEFSDGKIMLGELRDYHNLTFQRMLDAVGGEAALCELVTASDLVCLMNWTMTPHLTAIFENILQSILPRVPPREGGRIFFFDLSDPAKRSVEELRDALAAISRFQDHGHAILGLNLAEAKQVASALGVPLAGELPEDLQAGVTRIRQLLAIHCVVVHPRDGAIAATAVDEEAIYVAGPLAAHPKISTGAGDHFNAGFLVGVLLRLSTASCLTVAVATSGQYVRTAESPTLADTTSFMERWREGHVTQS